MTKLPSNFTIPHVSHIKFLLQDIERYADIFIHKKYTEITGLEPQERERVKVDNTVKFLMMNGACIKNYISVTDKESDQYFVENATAHMLKGFVNSYFKEIGTSLNKLGVSKDLFKQLFIKENDKTNQEAVSHIRNTNRSYQALKRKLAIDKGLPIKWSFEIDKYNTNILTSLLKVEKLYQSLKVKDLDDSILCKIDDKQCVVFFETSHNIHNIRYDLLSSFVAKMVVDRFIYEKFLYLCVKYGLSVEETYIRVVVISTIPPYSHSVVNIDGGVIQEAEDRLIIAEQKYQSINKKEGEQK